MNNILVIGNGYDIAHGLNTRYSDFIEFLKKMKRLEVSLEDKSEQDFVFSCIQKNGFLNYFLDYTNAVPGWVDLERLLNDITVYFEMFFNNYSHFIDTSCSISWNSNGIDMAQSKMLMIVNCLYGFDLFDRDDSRGGYYSMHLKPEYYTHEFGLNKREILNFLKRELDDVIRVLQIYLKNHMGEKRESLKMIDQISDIHPSYVISFNYTDTYRIYGISPDDVFHVHGCLDEDNLVLGFNDEKEENLDFIYFKKYFQRIQKLTGYLDIDRFCYVNEYGESNYDSTIVHFYGHSLDKTDEDIIKRLQKMSGGFVIYTYNQVDYEQKVINLIDIFGKESAMLMIESGFFRFVQCEL